jgi:L-ribulokinase
MYCDISKQQFRQHPLDYIEGLEQTVKECVTKAGTKVASNIRAITIDTTGSTPIAVDEKGKPLSLLPGFSEDPDAMFILWKDHTSIKEAVEINEHNSKSGTNYLRLSGGIYSSEWFWAKLLHVLRRNSTVREKCYTWVEHCDWMPFLLTGGDKASDIKRSVCAAGHKAMWAKEYGGFPPDSFFSSLDPLLSGYAGRLPTQTYTSDQSAGRINDEWARRLGLQENILIGIGALDAHMGAVGGQIEPYHLSKVMGTSTCDMLVAPTTDLGGNEVAGICGQVNGSIIPGMIGLEAGQSAFGDVYAWFRQLLLWPLGLLGSDTNFDRVSIQGFLEERILAELSKKASELPFDEQSELALDWLNGRRTPDANQALKGGITSLNLASDPPRIFRALAEATCFGAKKIVERFQQQGIQIKGLIGIGGVAKKSPFIMQMMADVMGMSIKIHRSEQTSAMGAAMFAATVAGVYSNVQEAMHKMGSGFDVTYHPDRNKTSLYGKRYELYSRFASFNEGLLA